MGALQTGSVQRVLAPTMQTREGFCSTSHHSSRGNTPHHTSPCPATHAPLPHNTFPPPAPAQQNRPPPVGSDTKHRNNERHSSFSLVLPPPPPPRICLPLLPSLSLAVQHFSCTPPSSLPPAAPGEGGSRGVKWEGYRRCERASEKEGERKMERGRGRERDKERERETPGLLLACRTWERGRTGTACSVPLSLVVHHYTPSASPLFRRARRRSRPVISLSLSVDNVS
jgi:hypothetical protein